jgi:predicted metalloprotease
MTKIRSTDDSRIQDRRGQRGGGASFPGLGGSIPIPGGKAGGGGLIGLLVIAAIIFLPRLLGGDDGTNPVTNAPGVTNADGEGEACQTELEQILCGATNDVAEFWIDEYPRAFGGEYVDTQTVFFAGSTNTECGMASSQTGPFYCPADGLVYFDLDFLVQLQEQFGATGDLATQYIVAHEYGHHVQNLTGQNAVVQRASGDLQRRLGIALELQADCYAGVWAYDAARRESASGLPLIEDGEIVEALEAARAVGDDRIQQQTQGRVDPESFTHGTSEQRESWFRRGYETGDPTRCTTFEEVL